MLNNLNQPKGSTIGVLRDGRTIQEAIEEIETVKAGKWTPKIIGEGTAGNTTLSASGGAYYLDNGMVTVSCFAVVDTKDPNMAGNLNIKLPVACEDQQRGGNGISLTNIPGVSSPNGSVIIIGDTARIMLGSARLQPENITTGTAIHFSVSYPADVKV
ncbi:hypothetical protein [Klebsiella phage vB_KpnP-VAC71]|uniref:Uncharacterized protein n=1 Tax=Klebsiella phage vB_KpnP-VAC71 TaxID=2866700 RepID=A0AAE8YEU4_9CAUD|nr:hypothetical protein [Klebsiella phage vB_KpnP-VAC71]